MKHFASTAFLILLFALLTFAQKPTPNPPDDDKDVVKISTTLIQVDATVTDKKGNIIRDLKPEDFEIYENNKKQQITNFSFISNISEDKKTISNQPAAGKEPIKSDKKLPIPVPPVKLKPEQIRHTYAIVVDDLGLSFSGVAFVKDAVKKFVREQMQEGDLVAILRVGAGLGALQSFTSDKRQLIAAIDKIRWNIMSRTGVNSFESISNSLIDDLGSADNPAQNAIRQKKNNMDKEFDLQTSMERQLNIANGTIGALNYVIRGMSELPGRKAILFFSEGFPTIDYSQKTPQSNGLSNLLSIITELANRASIVIYTFDPRGLAIPPSLRGDAADGAGPSAMGVSVGFGGDPFHTQDLALRDSQDSLKYLANETGGLAYLLNNMNKGIQKVVDDQNGYYLIGYQPDSETFDAKKSRFNKLTVKLKNPDLKIRYRSGFFSISDESIKEVKQTPGQQLNAALTSPFGATAVNLDLYSVFYNDEKNKNFIRSFIKIDPKDLAFTTEPDGRHKINIQIFAMTFGDNGLPVDRSAKQYTVSLDETTYQKVIQTGLIYDFLTPIKQSGAYQFRIALRDVTSRKIGSASQFTEVPNIDKKKLTLSNLVLKNYTIDDWKKLSSGQNSESKDFTAFLDTTTRQFKLGTVLSYSYVIYNAKVESGQKTQLQVQKRFFRDGKLILQNNPIPLDTTNEKDLRRIGASGAISLGRDFSPGNYVLQIVVTDGQAKEKNRIAVQSIDFEVTQ